MYRARQMRHAIISKYIVPFFVVAFVSFAHTYAEAITVKVGTFENPPLVFKDDQGILRGLIIDVLEYIASQEGWTLEYVHGTWPENLMRLERGETDIQIGIAYSAERAKKYDFNNETIFSNWGIIYSTPDADIESILDLEDKTIALVSKSIHTKEFIKLTHNFNINTKIIETNDSASVFRLIEEQKAYAGVVNRIVGSTLAKDYNIKKTPVIFNPIEIRYASLKGRNLDLIAAIDRYLRELKKDEGSIYYLSILHWFGTQKRFVLPLWMKSVIFSISGLLLLFLFMSIIFKRQINKKTGEIIQREEKFRLLFTTVPTGWSYHKIVTDENNKPIDYIFLEINKAFEIQTGLRRDNVIGRRVTEVLPNIKDDPADWIGTYGEVALTGNSIKINNFSKSLNKWFTISASSPKKEYFITVFDDITERRKLEEQLLQAQKMEAVGQLAGGIAHDFNNFLSAINSYVYLVQLKMKEDDPSRTYIDQIFSALEKTAALTQSLLAFSRKQVTNLRAIKLSDTVLNMEKILKRLIGEDIEFKVELLDENIIVEADSGQIEQVHMNLATNAQDAMPEGGSLRIKTEIIAIDDNFIHAYGYGKRGDYACIDISDTGAGLKEGTRQKIFEPFFTTKEFGKGTGLGLSVVYGIIKQHNGYINVKSEPGTGTSFSIYLPLVHRKPAQAAAEKRPNFESDSETILLAEDEEDVRNATKKLLEEFGYNVIEAVDGDDAISKFSKHKENIRLVILDVIMPKKSGKEVYDHIRKINSRINAIFLSGYSGEVLEAKKIYDEKLTVLNKPVSMNVFLSNIREALVQ